MAVNMSQGRNSLKWRSYADYIGSLFKATRWYRRSFGHDS